MGDWVERPWTVERPDDLDPVWRAALVSHNLRLSSDNPGVFVPAWKRSKKRKGEEKEWLLAHEDGGMAVLERSRLGEFTNYKIPYSASTLIEEGIALLYGWIELWWEHNRIPRKIRIEFNATEMPRLRKYTRSFLEHWGIRAPTQEWGNDPLLGEVKEGRELYRQILDYHLGPDESIERLLDQPLVYSLRGILRKRRHIAVSKQMVVQTQLRWIVLTDHDGTHNLEYGTKVVSLRRAHWNLEAPDNNTLAWKAGGETIKLRFPKHAFHFLDGSPVGTP